MSLEAFNYDICIKISKENLTLTIEKMLMECRMKQFEKKEEPKKLQSSLELGRNQNSIFCWKWDLENELTEGQENYQDAE